MSSKTSNQQNQMKSFYRQKKKNDSSVSKSSSSSSSKKPNSASATLGSTITQPQSLPHASTTDLQDERFVEEEEVLRQFDLNMAYGPCLGMNRLVRWDRASRLGLNPPKQVRALLEINSDSRSNCLWDARI